VIHAGMPLATLIHVKAFKAELKASSSSAGGHMHGMHMRAENLIHRAERWPAPLAILVASCAMMTAAVLWL
jgi:hypothetical protein